MAYNRDDEDDFTDRDRSGGSGGYGYSDSSHKSESKSDSKHDRDAKNFDTTNLVGEDGTFFGVKLSSGTASTMNAASNMLKPWLRRNFQEKGEVWAQNVARDHLGYTNAADAAKFGGKVGVALGYATIFSDQIADVGSNLASTYKSMNELRQAVTPTMRANGSHSHLTAMFGGGDNDIIKNARSKIRGIFLARNVQTLVKSVANIPQIMLWNEEEKVKRVQRLRVNALKGANDKDPEELAKLFEEEMGAGVSVNLEQVREKIWNRMWKAKTEKYLAGFKEFETAKKRQIEKEFFEELGFKGTTLKKEIDQPTFEMLERYGLSGYYKQKTVPRAGYKSSHGSWVPEDPVDGVYEIRAKDSTAEKALKKKIEQTVTDKIKCEYVKEHGALDESWKEKLNVGRGGRGRGYNNGYGSSQGSGTATKTLREETSERFNKAFDEANGLAKGDSKLKKEEEGGGKQIKEMAYTLGGSLVGDFFSGVFGTKSLEKYRKDISLDLILHLSRSMEKDDGLDHVPPRENGKGEGEVGFAKYIHSIFQKNQEDSRRSQIGERYYTHLKEAKWDDEEIQKLDDKDLNPYEFAIKHLSKAIKDRRLDPLSLITFVGDKKRKLVRDSGKAFGPIGAHGKDEQIKEAIAKELEEFGAQFRNKKEMTPEQISESMAVYTFDPKEMREHFASTSVSGEQKAFDLLDLETHITDPKLIKELTGLDEKALEKLRKEGLGRFSKYMDAGVLALSEMAEKEPEKLKTLLEMTEEEIDVIKTIACKIEKGGKNVVEAASKEDRKTLEASVLNANVSLTKEKDKDGPGFWQRLIERSRKKIEKAADKDGEDDLEKSASHGDGMDDYGDEERGSKKSSRHDEKSDKKKKKASHEEDMSMDDEFKSPRLDEEDDRPVSSFAEREKKRGNAFAKDDDKPMLERLSARKSRDESHGSSWDMSA